MFQWIMARVCVVLALIGLPAATVAGDSLVATEGQVQGEMPGDTFWQNLSDPAEGVHFEGTLTFDWSSNLHGGVNTHGSAFRHLLDIGLTLDTETLFGVQGGTLGMLFQNQNGPDASVQDTGDLQVFSNIDADGRTQLAEFWYEQVLHHGQLRVVIGKVDANSLFA